MFICFVFNKTCESSPATGGLSVQHFRLSSSGALAGCLLPLLQQHCEYVFISRL